MHHQMPGLNIYAQVGELGEHRAVAALNDADAVQGHTRRRDVVRRQQQARIFDAAQGQHEMACGHRGAFPDTSRIVAYPSGEGR